MNNNKKATKRALLTSVMALAMCVVMLVGTTFAWFTDTESTGVNKIQAGNLDIQLLMRGASGAYENIGDSHQVIFGDANSLVAQNNNQDTLWEPGKTQVAYLAVRNAGNLALKYNILLNVEDGGLIGALDYVIVPQGTKFGDDVCRENVASWDAVKADAAKLTAGTFTAAPNGCLDEIAHDKTKTNETEYFALVVHMDANAGNTYMNKSVTIDMKVVATQAAAEFDSFDNTYDAGAAASELKQGVTISGIAGVAESYDTIQDAYEAVKAMLLANSGLVEQPLSAEAFNAFFTDGGRITWTIYGNQKVTDNRMFSFGRAANRFGEGRHITEINIVGGNSSAALDLTAVNGTFALPYNWWNVADSANTTLKCKNITFNGIKYMPSATYQCTLYPTTYEFDGCTFNGDLYSYQNFDVNMTIKNCTFNAPADTTYAFMAQGKGGTITLDNNVFNNYTRGINLERATADFVITNNTIRSTVSESDRGAIQLTDGKSFVVTGNKVDVNAGNAFWFHNAATNADVTYTINNNDIKAPYIGYSGVTAFDVNTKITSSGNKFNSTDTTKCMKKGATVAGATNLTAIH
mgnify:CR=1 FL=1